MWFLELNNDEGIRVTFDATNVLYIRLSGHPNAKSSIHVVFNIPAKNYSIDVEYNDYNAFKRDKEMILSSDDLFNKSKPDRSPYAAYNVKDTKSNDITHIIRLSEMMYIRCNDCSDLIINDDDYLTQIIDIKYWTDQQITILVENKDLYKMIIDSRFKRYIDED